MRAAAKIETTEEAGPALRLRLVPGEPAGVARAGGPGEPNRPAASSSKASKPPGKSTRAKTQAGASPARNAAYSKLPAHARARAIELCDGVIDIMSGLFRVPSHELRIVGQQSRDLIRVRQIAMYVAHVTLRLPMTHIAIAFGRDHKTVVHACHLVEDLRDDVIFEDIVTAAERLVILGFAEKLDRPW